MTHARAFPVEFGNYFRVNDGKARGVNVTYENWINEIDQIRNGFRFVTKCNLFF